MFTQFVATVDEVRATLETAGVDAVTFHGGLSGAEKDRAIAAFASDARVLVSTDVGAEGRNLQFCRTVINYDLPWNPAAIEQRVGRVHRIGQPCNYAERLTEMCPGALSSIRLLSPDAYDLALSKLQRNADRDIEDVKMLARSGALNPATLRERYVEELRPYLVGRIEWHDQTLDLWVEMLNELGADGTSSR